MEMLVTVNMLLKALEPWTPTCHLSPVGTRRDGFRRLLLLPESFAPAIAQTLYLADAARWQSQQPEAHHWLVCVGAPPQDMLCNLILLPEHADLAQVLNCLLTTFEGIAQWERELAVAVSCRSSLPELLRISEPQFENPVVIVDWSLRPVAFTVGIPFTHPDLLHLAQKGSFTDAMVAAISAQDYFTQGEEYRKPAFHHPPNHLDCTQIVKSFAPNPLRLNMLCLYGVNRQPDESDLDKLLQLTDLIEQYSRSFHKDELETYERDIYLLIDLLENRVDKQELALKAPLLGLQLTADYRFYCIVFQTHIPMRANHLAGQLRTEFPHCRTFVYHSKLWMLAQEQEGSMVHQILPKLSGLLELHHARCGIGSPFRQLDMLGEGYLQASQAHELGHRLNPERRCYHYYEYYVFHLLSCAAKEITWQQLYHSQLNRIIDSDRLKGSDNLRLLDIHLNCDRNISATAQTLHLHRNSVVYRLERIEEMLGMSLDDAEVRLRLLISLKALRYMELAQEE